MKFYIEEKDLDELVQYVNTIPTMYGINIYNILNKILKKEEKEPEK